MIICNAGVMAVPTRCETSDGFEMQSGSPRGNKGETRIETRGNILGFV